MIAFVGGMPGSPTMISIAGKMGMVPARHRKEAARMRQRSKVEPRPWLRVAASDDSSLVDDYMYYSGVPSSLSRWLDLGSMELEL